LAFRGPPAAGAAARVEADLARTAVVTLAPSGGALRLATAPDVAESSRAILRALVALIQVSLRDGDSWTADEQDPAGRYRARYERRDGSLVKTKHYLPPAADEDSPADVRLESAGATRIELDGDAVRSLRMEETVTTLLAGRALGTTRTEAKMVHLSTRPIPTAAPPSGLRDGPLFEPGLSAAAEHEIH